MRAIQFCGPIQKTNGRSGAYSTPPSCTTIPHENLSCCTARRQRQAAPDHLGLATSKDGVHFERKKSSRFRGEPRRAGRRIRRRPAPRQDRRYLLFDLCGARIRPRAVLAEEWVEGVSKSPMYLEDTDVYSPELPSLARENTTVSYLAATKDFLHYKKLGRLTEATVDDRDVYLFPEKIGGNYVLISRPKFKDAGLKMPSIWISFGRDLLEYGKPQLLMTGEQWWEVQRIGGGTPPKKQKKDGLCSTTG